MGKTEDELQKEVQIIRTFSVNTLTEFGLEKYIKTILKMGKSVHS
jgi:hypothetical protein